MGGKHGIGIPTLPRFQTGSLEAPTVASTFVPGAERPMDATAKQRRMEQAWTEQGLQTSEGMNGQKMSRS